MTRASFYFNVNNRQEALCQLVGKALRQGLKLGIATDSPAATQVLDRLLWEIPLTGFLPHCSADHPLATQTPILLDHRIDLLPPCDVVFSWRNQATLAGERFARVVEIVERGDEEGKAAARARVASYKAAGCTVDFTDMATLAKQNAG